MRWKLKSEGSDETVDVTLIAQERDRYTFQVGKEVVTLTHPQAYPFSLRTDEIVISFEAWSEKLWRAVARGQTFNIQSLSLEAKGTSEQNEIRSAMPGRVLKVLATPGQKVKAKETLLIVEAMKMENEIRSERDSEVEAIEVKAGQSIESGTLLLKFKTAI